jgi:tetratricopeptide (TPR) repeat protein
MSRRHVIVGLGLLVLAIIAGTVAWRLWRHQQLTVAALAGVAPTPDLSRWPAEFSQRIQTEESAIRSGHQPVEALGRLAELYFVNGFSTEAGQALGVLRQLDSATSPWPYLQADLRLRVGDNPGAAEGLRDATMNPASHYAPAWIKLGDVHTALSQFAKAELCYAAAVDWAPDGDVRAAFAQISFQSFHGKRGDPRKELQQLVTAHPGIKPLHELLARMNEAAGDAAGAATQRRLANASNRYLPLDDPWIDDLYVSCFDPNRLTLLAGKMEREGRYEAAIARLNRAIALAPTESALRNFLARVYIVANQPAQAVTVLRQAAADCPDDPVVREQLAMLLRTGKRHEEALAVVREALVRWPQDAALHAALGQALREAGKMPEALNASLTALQLDAGQPEACYTAAYCLFAAGRRDEAKTYLAKALEIRPDYREALLLRAGMAIEEGDVAAAEVPINRLMALRGDEGDVRLLFAALHLIKGKMARDGGNPAEAARFFRTGLEVFPEFIPLLREAGLLARSQGRGEEASQLFERGLRAAAAQGNPAQAAEFRKLLGR